MQQNPELNSNIDNNYHQNESSRIVVADEGSSFRENILGSHKSVNVANSYDQTIPAIGENLNPKLKSKLKPRESIIHEAPLLVQQRRYSIEPTPANMSKIIRESFKVESTDNQKQMVSFFSELPSEEKYPFKEDISDMYINCISNGFFQRLEPDDAHQASFMLMEIAKNTPTHPNLIPIVIILTQVPADSLR